MTIVDSLTDEIFHATCMRDSFSRIDPITVVSTKVSDIYRPIVASEECLTQKGFGNEDEIYIHELLANPKNDISIEPSPFHMHRDSSRCDENTHSTTTALATSSFCQPCNDICDNISACYKDKHH